MTNTEAPKLALDLTQHDYRFPKDRDDYCTARLALLADEIGGAKHRSRCHAAVIATAPWPIERVAAF